MSFLRFITGNMVETVSFCVATVVVMSTCGAVIENDALRIVFGGKEDGFAISSIENKLVGNARFVRPQTQRRSDFWEIALVSRDTTGGIHRVALNNRSPAMEMRAEALGDETRFVWKGIDIPGGEKAAVDVVARVFLPAGDAASEWRLAVRNRSAHWALYDTSYPQLRGIVSPGEADVLMPYENLGARLLKRYDGRSRNRLCQWGEYPYPSYFPPVAAYMIGEAGLYFAAHDPDARIKRMWTLDLDAWFETPVENAGVVGKAAEGPRYAVTIAAFKGDWWHAAKRYRAWAIRQKWCSKGPIATRTDYPDAMARPSLWMSRGMDEAKDYAREPNKVRADLKDATPGLRVYSWHTHGMDWNFPEFLPMKDGVSETFDRLRKDGWTVMPYVNGRLWDTKLMSFPYARPDACMRDDGSVYCESWSGKPYGRHDFAIMCPAVARWRELLRTLAVRTVDETHANAIYFDQIGCSAPRECCNPAHGHPLGGGTWWADGNREIFRRVRETLGPKGVALTTEGTSECYIDLCDGQLVVTASTGEDVPFYPAVYSGYTIYFGTRQSARKDFDMTFAMMAREFVWGVANGWSDDWYPNRWGTVKETAEAACAFAMARESARDFLVYGTLEDELRPLDSLERKMWTKELFSGTNKMQHEFRMAAVVGSWWRSEDGRLALVAVNVTDRPQSLRFRVFGTSDESRLELKPREIFVRRY